ncbi:MAG: hypothetical protein ACOYD4_04040 [Solirubrobacterales bacterium]
MADRCDAFRTNLAQQTPVFDQKFLPNFNPLNSAVMGRHETGVWETGTGDTHTFDTITVGQPNLQNRWQRVNAGLSSSGAEPQGECTDACMPPRVFVAGGSKRSTYFPEQLDLQSQIFCLTQLEHSTKPSEQVAEWYSKIKQLPEFYNTDFLQVHAADMNTAIQICSMPTFPTLTPAPGAGGNISGQLTTINCAASGLPTSQLTFPYLNYLTTQLDLDGYHEAESGLPADLFNLITDPRSWFNMTNGAPEMKNMMALTGFQQSSPLYKIGSGIQQPFGNIAPTLNPRQIRFQASGTMLYRVEPYINTAATTGLEPIKNPAWINARYGLSFIWHPKAIKLWTKSFAKIHEKIPSVNSAMYGKWNVINDGVLMVPQPDGTTCTIRNDNRKKFYWLCEMYLGFQFKYSKFLYPIIHLLDGSGKDCATDSPVCGSAPQYAAQDYSNNPIVCET